MTERKTAWGGALYGEYEVARSLGVSPGLVAQWFKRGKLPEPTARLAMGPVWNASAIEPWLAEVRQGKEER